MLEDLIYKGIVPIVSVLLGAIPVLILTNRSNRKILEMQQEENRRMTKRLHAQTLEINEKNHECRLKEIDLQAELYRENQESLLKSTANMDLRNDAIRSLSSAIFKTDSKGTEEPAKERLKFSER